MLEVPDMLIGVHLSRGPHASQQLHIRRQHPLPASRKPALVLLLYREACSISSPACIKTANISTASCTEQHATSYICIYIYEASHPALGFCTAFSKQHSVADSAEIACTLILTTSQTEQQAASVPLAASSKPSSIDTFHREKL